ncbi:hypothetical protein Q0590_27300 [Rhodocytophaga aerolata]|uniref:T9SS type A sorting domain-containing protein n=1 Tax=Rhodocytophaga aerolata TaxID=455078 RepID=A0ABT8RD44_9BACT|nr:hypothetical protein [Rhodocytophaga aerolata]MDO1450017.1 hypothetical protein [Rhodocytophaga aerolata]
MNTFNFFCQIAIVAVGGILILIPNQATAQTEANVLAISKDGTSHKAPTSLRVAIVHSNDPLTFKVCLENLSASYAMMVLKDEKGQMLVRKFVLNDKKAVTRFNMSKLTGGLYTIEVSNKTEKHSFQIKLLSTIVRSVEIKPGILATLPK